MKNIRIKRNIYSVEVKDYDKASNTRDVIVDGHLFRLSLFFTEGQINPLSENTEGGYSLTLRMQYLFKSEEDYELDYITHMFGIDKAVYEANPIPPIFQTTGEDDFITIFADYFDEIAYCAKCLNNRRMPNLLMYAINNLTNDIVKSNPKVVELLTRMK